MKVIQHEGSQLVTVVASKDELAVGAAVDLRLILILEPFSHGFNIWLEYRHEIASRTRTPHKLLTRSHTHPLVTCSHVHSGSRFLQRSNSWLLLGIFLSSRSQRGVHQPTSLCINQCRLSVPEKSLCAAIHCQSADRLHTTTLRSSARGQG